MKDEQILLNEIDIAKMTEELWTNAQHCSQALGTPNIKYTGDKKLIQVYEEAE